MQRFATLDELLLVLPLVRALTGTGMSPTPNKSLSGLISPRGLGFMGEMPTTVRGGGGGGGGRHPRGVAKMVIVTRKIKTL